MFRFLIRKTSPSKIVQKFSTLLILQLFVVTLTALVFASSPSISLDVNFNAGVKNGNSSVYFAKPLTDGKIIVGGTFRSANDMPIPYLVRLNSDGSTDVTFNSGSAGPNGSVYELVMQSDGKFLISGAFTAYNGVSKSLIARINADGSLDSTFNANIAGANAYVNKIALQTDGKILVSGNLSGSISRLNSDGSPDTSFTSPFNSSSLVEEIIYLSDGDILIGGIFAGNVARLNADGSIDSAFSPTEQFGDVYAMILLSDGKILIGGNFSFSGFTAPAIKRLNSDGSTDQSFSTGAAVLFNRTNHFAIQTDGKILAAGYFTNNGLTMLALVRLNSDGSSDNLFSIPVADSSSNHVSLQSDGKILLSGDFLSVNGQSKPGIVRLNSDGSIDNSFNASFYGNSVVQTLIQQPDGKILASGGFIFANGTSKKNITRFNSDGTLDTSFDPGSGLVSDYYSGFKSLFDTELQSDGKILLAGVFYGYNDHRSRGIVRLNSDGTVDTSFEADISGGIIWVYDVLVLPDGKILASVFTTDQLTGFGYFGVLSLNPDGSSDSAFFGVDGTVRKIARQQDGKILIGGYFTNSRAISRHNADGTPDSTFNSNTAINGTILDIAVQPDGKILIGGTFTMVGGAARNRIARLNADGTLDTTFNPGSGADSTVYKIVVLPNGKIAAGGNFNTLSGASRNRIGILNSDGSLDTTFQSGLDNNSSNTVRSLLVQNDGKLVLGGFFESYNGVPRNSIARLLTSQSNSTPFDFDGDRKTDISIFRPSNGQWWYQRSSDGQVPVFQFGNGSDKMIPADYTGDGKTDIAVWRESTGEWFILRSEDGSFFSFTFGTAGDIPVSADFDGDGKSDTAIFRPSTAEWFINRSSGGTTIEQFGINGDSPVVADFDGDGKADIAVFRPSNGQWWINRSSSGAIAVTFGSSTDKPVQGDYTGDGKADIAFWRPSSGEWFILRSEDSSFFAAPFGAMGDIPSPGDYDGDGKFDLAVFRPTGSNWYVNRSTAGLLIQQFGLSTDKPVPSAFVY